MIKQAFIAGLLFGTFLGIAAHLLFVHYSIIKSFFTAFAGAAVMCAYVLSTDKSKTEEY